MLRSRAVALKQSYAAPTLWVLMLKVISSLFGLHDRVCHGCRKSVSPFREPSGGIRQSTKFRSEGPTLPDCRWCLVAYRNAVV